MKALMMGIMTVFVNWPTSSDNEAHFIGIINVEKRDAEMTTLGTFCTRKMLDIRKCRFVGFDGACQV